MAHEIIIHSFNKLETSNNFKEVKHFERFWISGLYPTNNSLIYFGDISEKQANGYTRKVSFLFFVFKYDNSRMVIFEYPNYYPHAVFFIKVDNTAFMLKGAVNIR